MFGAIMLITSRSNAFQEPTTCLPVLWNEGKVLAPQTPLGFTHVCVVIRSQHIPDDFVWC